MDNLLVLSFSKLSMINLSRPSVVKINENEYITGLKFLNEMVRRFINIKISDKREREQVLL